MFTSESTVHYATALPLWSCDLDLCPQVLGTPG